MKRITFTILCICTVSVFAGKPPYTNGTVFPLPVSQSQVKTLLINPTNIEIINSINPVKSLNLAKRFLEEKIKSLPAQDNGLNVKLTIARVNDNIWKNTVFADVSDLPAQGYQLKFKTGGNTLNIYAIGADNRGVFYAAASIIQLLYEKDGKAYINACDISDHPLWLHRYMGGYNPVRADYYESLALYKINGYGIQHRYDWKAFSPDKKPKYYRRLTYAKAFADIRKFREANGDLVDFMILLNVYAKCKKKIDISNSSEVQSLIDKCVWAAEYCQSIMIQADDYSPQKGGKYILLYPGEQKMFKNAGEAHGYLVKRIYETVKSKYPDVNISFCAAPYSLNKHSAKSKNNREYLNELARQLPDEVPVVWTGGSIETSNVTATSHKEYRQLVDGQPLFLWDNSSNMPSNPLSIWNTKIFPGMEQEDGGMMYINGHGFSFFWSWLFAINANDYLWNPKAYDSSQSYSQAYYELKGASLPEFVNKTREDIVAIRKYMSREEKLKLAKRILSRKQDFNDHKLDFRHVKYFGEKFYKNSSIKIAKTSVPSLKKDFNLKDKDSDFIWNSIPALKLTASESNLKYPATVKMAYTPGNLYLRFSCQYSKRPTEKQKKLERDTNLNNSSDILIIGIQPPQRNQRSGWICIDIAGSVYDNVQWQGAYKFNPKFDYNINVADHGWTLDCKIPVAQLKPYLAWRHIRKNDKWRMNFIRNNNIDREVSSWSPVSGKKIKDKKFFGQILFK